MNQEKSDLVIRIASLVISGYYDTAVGLMHFKCVRYPLKMAERAVDVTMELLKHKNGEKHVIRFKKMLNDASKINKSNRPSKIE